MAFRNPDGGWKITASHTHEVLRCSTVVHLGTLTPPRRLKSHPATSDEAALDSRIGQACSREHRGRGLLIIKKNPQADACIPNADVAPSMHAC